MSYVLPALALMVVTCIVVLACIGAAFLYFLDDLFDLFGRK